MNADNYVLYVIVLEWVNNSTAVDEAIWLSWRLTGHGLTPPSPKSFNPQNATESAGPSHISDLNQKATIGESLNQSIHDDLTDPWNEARSMWLSTQLKSHLKT